MREIQSHANFALSVILPWQCIVQRFNICTRVKPPAQQMSPAVAGPAECILHHPALGAPLGGIKKWSLLVDTEENFLNHFLRFAPVIQNSQRDSEHQPCVTAVKQVQSLGILGLHPSH